MTKKYTGRIIDLEVTHRPYRGIVRGARHRVHAQMSLWAITDTGHRVWLQRTYCDTRRIETKLDEYLGQNEFRIGEEVNYVLRPSRNGLDEVGFRR